MKKISICFYLILIIGLCGCLSSNIYNASDEVSNGSSINTPTNGIEETSVPTPTRKVSSGPIVEPTRTPLTINKPKITSTPAPSINDVEIYFEPEKIVIKDKSETYTVLNCVKRNGYDESIEFDVSLSGDENWEVDCGDWEEGEITKRNIDFKGLNNGVSYLTISVKGTDKKATLEIVVDIPIPENIIHEDEYIKICFSKIGKDGVEFIVENKTDYVLTIQADAIAINGYSTNDILMSEDIAPKSKGKAVARCDDFEHGMIVEKISGQLSVIDFSYELLERSYDVKFIDVEIE